MNLNNLSAFFAMAMARLTRSEVRAPRPNGNRAKVKRVRGYIVNGERVYYRPAAKWLPNKRGMRYTRDESKGGIVSKMVPR